MNPKLPHEWAPRPYQNPSWEYLRNGGKRLVKNWHRRSGKDALDLNHMACAMEERVGTYWYMLPEYGQARKAMWEAMDHRYKMRRIDKAFPLYGRSQTKEQEMFFRWHNGSTFQLVGADSFHSLVGSPPIGLVFSEYARTDPSAWAYLMPILEENGGWVCFNSTPFGDNHFRSLCDLAAKEEDWFYSECTVDQTKVYQPKQLEAIHRQLTDYYGDEHGAALFQQEYYCSFDAAIPGSIWGDCLTIAEADGRIYDYPIDCQLPVDTAWDLGRTDDTSIGWFQMNGKSLDLFDHHASSLKDIPFYVDVLLAKQKEHGIRYGTHYLPHDARPRTLAAGGLSILQQFHRAQRDYPQLGRFVIGPRLDRQEGIQAARNTFPSVRFHADRTKKLRRSLRHYHREWDDIKKMFTDSPHHDWASHDADMFRYLSLSWRHAKKKKEEPSILQRIFSTDVRQQTFGDLRKKHFEKREEARSMMM